MSEIVCVYVCVCVCVCMLGLRIFTPLYEDYLKYEDWIIYSAGNTASIKWNILYRPFASKMRIEKCMNLSG